MQINILFSGSKGNATLIKSGSTEVLIDCGKSARAVCNAVKSAGSDIKNIDAVFITHEHTDHTSALAVLCKKIFLPVHAVGKSAEKLKEKDRINGLICHDDMYETVIGEIKVKSFRVPHDSLENVGYVISDKKGDTLGIVTDIGQVTETVKNNLLGCRRVIIESNHDIEMLKNGAYPAELKSRILSPRGHLSNRECSIFACELAKNGCEVFALAHISQDNNTFDTAYEQTRSALNDKGFTRCAVVTALPEVSVNVPDGLLDIELSDKEKNVCLR